jgi:hypothetical protein
VQETRNSELCVWSSCGSLAASSLQLQRSGISGVNESYSPGKRTWKNLCMRLKNLQACPFASSFRGCLIAWPCLCLRGRSPLFSRRFRRIANADQLVIATADWCFQSCRVLQTPRFSSRLASGIGPVPTPVLESSTVSFIRILRSSCHVRTYAHQISRFSCQE